MFAQRTCKEETAWEVKQGKASIKRNLKGRGCIVVYHSRGLHIGFSDEIL
jgi:hypothetical protein